jgi:hypothetical protein
MLKILNNLKKLRVEINLYKGKRRTPYKRRPSLGKGVP